MKAIYKAAALASVLLAAACAQSPEAIQPVSMGNAYAGLACGNARTELAAERQRLATLEAAQRSAVAGDALGVFLIGVPMSSLSGGDQAGAIAASKGKVLALEGRLVSCGVR